MIIGLAGYARSGKDEAAKALQEIGFQRLAFADILREFLYKLNPWVISTEHNVKHIWQTTRTLQGVIDYYGWDGYKDTLYAPQIRAYLQRLGTECGRELLGENIWVNATLRGYDDIVVTDVRFPNEAQAIEDRDGRVVRIVRPGVGPANEHVSETAMDDWDCYVTINNDGTIEDLHRSILDLVAYERAL